MKRKSHKQEFTEACVSAVLHDFTMILKRTQVFLEAFEKSHDMNVRVIETVYIETNFRWVRRTQNVTN
jgi:hypothetical protein